MRAVRLISIDLDDVLGDVPTRGAAWLHVTVLRRGRPLAVFTLSAPVDPLPGWVMADAVERAIARTALAAQIEDALVPEVEVEMDRVAVVVCTRDRPDDLARCLDSLALLDPRPGQVVVVDNGTATAATRAAVESRGFEYVHEPIPGLDRARNRGVAATDADVVLFTDDDVVVDPRWAGRLAASFADPLVAAASGLVLPAQLDPPERWEFERLAGFSRGLRRIVLEGTTSSPYRAASVGAGASLGCRRAFLTDIGGFPEALDAGTPTRSGGDTYVIARALHAGLRVVYEPGAVAAHLHRATPEALEAVLRGYGTGTISYLAQMALDTKDPAVALTGFPWAARYFGRRFVRALARPHDRRRLRLAAAEVAGAVEAAAAYPRARRAARDYGPVLRPSGRDAVETAVQSVARRIPMPEAADGAGLPRLSVVIPTRGRRDRVLGLLHALGDQDYPAELLQVVVVVDGDIDGTAGAIRGETFRLTPDVVVLASPSADPHVGNGPAVARNEGAAAARGDILVFLDDDVVPAHPGVLRAHALAHRDIAGGDLRAAVVGPLPPILPPHRTPAALIARNWWVDVTDRLLAGGTLAFTDLSSGNVSVARRFFEELGGFAALPRREDWEFGYRVRRAGGIIRAEPGAAVFHEVDGDARNRLLDRFREGAGDALLARRHPGALWSLPLAARGDLRPVVGAAVERLAGKAFPVALLAGAGALVLRLVAALGLRETHARLFGRLGHVSYWLGATSVLGDRRSWPRLLAAARAARTWTPPVDLASRNGAPRREPTEGVVPLRWEDAPVGEVPVHYGTVPWRHDAFARKATETARLPLLRHVVRRGAA